MKVTPLTIAIGAEVSGIDLNSLDDASTDDLYEALMDRGVLVFRDQHLEPAAHVALGQSFGPLAHRHPLYPTVDGFDDITRIQNDEHNPPENEVWHSDLSCRSNPPFVAVLRGHTIPPVGGDTLWADMRAVHDALSPTLRSVLADVDAVHTLAHGFRFLDDFVAADENNDLQQSRKATLDRGNAPDAAAKHPVIVHHPATGRPLIYVNESFTLKLAGVPENESHAILSALYAEVRNPRHQVRLRWSPGIVVIWDNWSTQHFACGDHYPAKREVQRVTVASNRRSKTFSDATR